MRDFNKEIRDLRPDLIRNLLSDSSPQGHENWQLSEVHTIYEPVALANIIDELLALNDEEDMMLQIENETRHIDDELGSVGVEGLEASCARSQRKGELLHRLLTGTQRHMLPPSALGMRKASLPHKVSSIVHSLQLELWTTRDLREYLETIMNVTTDLGTEKGVGDVPDLDVSAVLPQLNMMGYADDSGMDAPCAETQECDTASSAAKFLFKNSLSLAGVLHALHGATKDLVDSMPNYEPFFSGPFRTLVSVLSQSAFRKYLVSRCYSEEPLNAFANRFDHFSATLVDHRWGYLISAGKTIKELEVVLRAGWNQEKLLNKNVDQHVGEHSDNEREEGADEPPDGQVRARKKGAANVSDADIKLATQFVTSPGRWAYLDMLLTVSLVIEMLTAWFESCPCHPSRLLGLSGDSWGRRYRAFISEFRSESHGVGSLKKPCPMKGRHAWRVAKGVHWERMSQWWQEARENIVLTQAGVTVATHRQYVLADFDLGRTKIVEMLQIKWAYQCTIPFKLAILCDPCQASARSGYRECLQQYAGGAPSVESENPDHHRLSVKFCDPASPLYALGIRFLNGACLKSEPLAPLRAQSVKHFYFLMHVERSAERNHALAKMQISKSPNHTEAYFSLGTRISEIEDVIDGDAENGLLRLGAHCDSVRKPEGLALKFGFASHPDFVNLRTAGAVNSKVMETLRSIVYRCDIVSQQSHLK